MRTLLVAVALLFSATALANTTLRCGTYVIQGGVGTTQYEVLTKCGPPAYVDEGRFIYDRGSSRFLTVLVFHGGVLNAVRNSADR
jgi:hypothetical protein